MELAISSIKPLVIAIVGPTGSGKTELAVTLSEYLRSAEIISADSRQIYRSMDIGTAKPTTDQQHRCKHHFIDILDPDQEYSAGKFGITGQEKVQQLLHASTVPIICGGSGLYLKALFEGLAPIPEISQEIRSKVRSMVKTEGNVYIYNLLTKVDPSYSNKTDATKTQRNCRALEVFFATGKPFSSFHGRSNASETSFQVIKIGLSMRRDALYQRINLRVDKMIADGLVTETSNLLKAGYTPEMKALRTVGYKECIQYLEGKISFDEMIRLIKQHTRNYAKRQLTWFTADKSIQWIDADPDISKEQKIRSVLQFMNMDGPR